MSSLAKQVPKESLSKRLRKFLDSHILNRSNSMMHRRLVLFGGGIKPRAALNQFIDWAGGQHYARILFIAWASDEPEISCDLFIEELKSFDVSQADVSVAIPESPKEKDFFLTQLSKATGI